MARTTFSTRPRLEWPTLALALIIYAGWGLLTFFHDRLPVLLLIPCASWIMAWHMSLQHEAIHDHPTPWRRVNDLLVVWPLSLWLPFAVYRHSHRQHHRNEFLTDPVDDPESYYLTDAQALALRRRFPFFYRVTDTLLGRVLLGPARFITVFLYGQGRRLLAGNRDLWRVWAWHLLAMVPVLTWLVLVCRMPLWFYVLAFVYPGFALGLVRSFAEHRAAGEVMHRTAIVENAPLMGLLFLYNNLHAVHHDRPGLPWYEIPSFYRRHRTEIVRANGGLVYDGYLDVARRFLLRPHDELVHPDHQPPDRRNAHA